MAQLSVGLLAFAAGAIIGMQVAGPIVDRFRSANVMIPAVLADGVALLAPASAVNLATLAVCLLGFGAVHGTLNVAMNVNAVEVQRQWGRPIISSCHAVYSIGGFAGAAIGALAIPAVLAFFVALAAPALRTATSPAPSLAEAS